MTQPKFAPIAIEDEVRAAYRLAPPDPWRPRRPADLPAGRRETVRGGGVPGPDQGYALHLAERLAGRLELGPGEHAEDALAAAVAVALRRAALFGRAPVSGDVELALELFGCLSGAPEDLAAYRRATLSGAAHDYAAQRAIAASVPEETLRSTPAAVRAGRDHWRELLGA